MMQYQWVEDMLRRAAGQFRHLPRAGPVGYRGWWPDYELTYKEPRSDVVMDMDLIDDVLSMMSAAPLPTVDKRIVWARVRGGKLRAWRKVGKKVGKSHEHCRNRYHSALAELGNYLINKDK